MRKYRDLTFSSKVRFWAITVAILIGVVFAGAISYSVIRGDGIKASGKAFGAEGAVTIGQAKD